MDWHLPCVYRCKPGNTANPPTSVRPAFRKSRTCVRQPSSGMTAGSVSYALPSPSNHPATTTNARFSPAFIFADYLPSAVWAKFEIKIVEQYALALFAHKFFVYVIPNNARFPEHSPHRRFLSCHLACAANLARFFCDTNTASASYSPCGRRARSRCVCTHSAYSSQCA